MIVKREIGSKGQVVIPKDIREMLRLRRGETVVFEIKGDEVIIKKEQNPEEFLRDFFDTPKLRKKISWKEIKKELEERHERRNKIR